MGTPRGRLLTVLVGAVLAMAAFAVPVGAAPAQPPVPSPPSPRPLTPEAPEQASADPAPLSASLVEQVARSTGAPLPVLVHGVNLAAAHHAVTTNGLARITSFDKIGVVAALATPSQVEALRRTRGVTYVEGNTPIRYLTTTSQQATRSANARTTLTGANGAALDGSGVSIAVIDTGIDPNHPSFAPGKVVRNLKSVCFDELRLLPACVADVPLQVDSDTLSVGGHGTHVTGIAAGYERRLTDGAVVSGAAPGAKVISLSAGLSFSLFGTDAALNWVLDNHAAPCGPGVPVEVCPPIKVTNNSYGPSAVAMFDPMSATVKLQRALAREGVVTVWAAGNDGGDGRTSKTNPPGHDPTGGIISVAAFSDLNTGTRDGRLADFSSRGAAANRMTWPDLSAPGEQIVSSCRPYQPICALGLQPQNGPGPLDIGTFNTISGTSMAAPHVAGIVAQLFQAKPTASPAEVEATLVSTAYRYRFGAPYVGGSSPDKGAGLVDAEAAARALGARPR